MMKGISKANRRT